MRATGHANRSVQGPAIAARQRLADLFDTEFDAVYRYCLARTGDMAAADDAASEAFLAASRAFAEGRGGDVDRPWLFVVARNRMVDQWRSNERQRNRINKIVRQRRPEWSQVEVGEQISDVAEQVIVAMSSMPERQRVALALRYLDECSVAEVAESLRLNFAAAESLLARARRSFAAAWRSHHD